MYIVDVAYVLLMGIDVSYTPLAEQKIADFERLGFGNLPICVAKTQVCCVSLMLSMIG